MKVRIYPKIRYYDSELLDFAVAKKVTAKIKVSLLAKVKTIVEKVCGDYNVKAEQSIDFIPQHRDVVIGGKEYQLLESYPRITKLVDDATKELKNALMPSREEYTEVPFMKFRDNLRNYFPKLFTMQKVKESTNWDYIEAELEQDDIDKYLFIFDHQIEVDGKWVSGNNFTQERK